MGLSMGKSGIKYGRKWDLVYKEVGLSMQRGSGNIEYVRKWVWACEAVELSMGGSWVE